MAYVSYTGLATPNDVISKIADYVTSQGYTIDKPLSDDLNIYDQSSVDGKVFAFKDVSNAYTVVLRSANGNSIFGVTNEAVMDTTAIVSDTHYEGIGMTVGESFSSSVRWYNQDKAPHLLKSNIACGVFMPVPTSLKDGTPTYTLYCNRVKSPSDTLVFSIVKENDSYYQTAHLVVGILDKYDEWTGGIYFSGSANQDMQKTSYACFEHDKSADSAILPVLSSGEKSNTFLRINIDEAPKATRGTILWASGGTDNMTGKQLSSPIRVENKGNGEIPHYGYLQSQDRLDWGKNINTLNCITIDMPIYLAVCVDPDVLQNYAAVGTVSGVSFVSMLNLQTGFTYNRAYPDSAKLDQVFSVGKRRGAYGYDGIAINQEDISSGTTS